MPLQSLTSETKSPHTRAGLARYAPKKSALCGAAPPGEAEQYRDGRLDSERECLEHRLSWAIDWGGVAGVKWIQRRFDQLADEALTDIDASCTPGHLESWKRELLPCAAGAENA
ncbi:hypothetical protein [Halomonas hibernica]|uniref:hypothetical protein n=1 Tax=Halomonas hibernica TaxID=2591147 RepID=UPI001555D891|nr:hypothetical protein [Halomonas hibernica]